MKGLLRSVIDYGGISQENLIANFQKLIQSRIEWPRPADGRIYKFLRAYFHQMMELPSKQTIIDHFEASKDQECIERVGDHEVCEAYSRTNFTHMLHETLKELNQVRAVTILKESQEIITRGLIIEEETKRGVKDGIDHILGKIDKLLESESTAETKSALTEDIQKVRDDYLDAKINSGSAWGRFCGLNSVDSVIGGLHPGQLWVHAGFVGELKSTLAMNMAYNQAVRYKRSSLYVSLEMPIQQIRRIFAVLHSANGIWAAKGYQPLDYAKVKRGKLTRDEEEFFNLVLYDLEHNEEYAQVYMWSPEDNVRVKDIKAHAEVLHHTNEIDLLVIDHGGLVRPEYRSKDYTIELNSVVRDCKRLAMGFDQGKQIPLLLLFQLNRQGKDWADAHEGKYRLSALSYANESERSADLVTTTYLNDEHRANGTTKFSCLKVRDGAPFEDFLAEVHFPSRRIRNLNIVQEQVEQGISLGLDNMFADLGGV